MRQRATGGGENPARGLAAGILQARLGGAVGVRPVQKYF
jgi:hypothetical protein